MTYDQLLAKSKSFTCCSGMHELALEAVMELHKPNNAGFCSDCTGMPFVTYPCPTIQAIEKELS